MRITRRSIAIGLIILALLPPALAGATLQRRLSAGQHIDLHLGELRLLVYETRIPGCSPEGPCPEAIMVAQQANGNYYVAWLLYPKTIGTMRMTAGRRLLTIPVSTS